MTHRVVITAQAKIHLYESALWWAEHRSVEQAAAWVESFEVDVATLTENPERHPAARENHIFDYTLRRLAFGIDTKPTHRILFEVRGERVYIRAVRHLHRDAVTPDELG